MAPKLPVTDQPPVPNPLQYHTWVLKVSIHCEGCKKKVQKILRGIEGVYTAVVDSQQHKVTVTGDVGVETIIKKLLRSGKHAELWPDHHSDKKPLVPGHGKSINNDDHDKQKQPNINKNASDNKQQHDEKTAAASDENVSPPGSEKEGGGECQGEAFESTGGGSGSGQGKKKRKKKKKSGQMGNSSESVGAILESSNGSPVPPAAGTDPIPSVNLGRPPQQEYYHLLHPSAQQQDYSYPPVYHHHDHAVGYNTAAYPSATTSYNYAPSMHAYSYYHDHHPPPAGRPCVPAPPPSDPIRTSTVYDHHDDHDDGEEGGSGCSIM